MPGPPPQCPGHPLCVVPPPLRTHPVGLRGRGVSFEMGERISGHVWGVGLRETSETNKEHTVSVLISGNCVNHVKSGHMRGGWSLLVFVQAVIWGGKKCEKYLGLFGTIWEMEIGFSKNQTDTKHLQFLGWIEIVQSQALPSQDCYLQKCPGKATESALQTVRNTYFMRKCKSEKNNIRGF